MKFPFSKKDTTPDEPAVDAWDDTPASDTGNPVGGTPLLRTPTQTVFWVLLRKPVWGSLVALLVVVLAVGGVVAAKKNDSVSGTVSAAVKEVPRAATPKPSFVEDEDPTMPSRGKDTDTEEEDPDGEDDGEKENTNDDEETDNEETDSDESDSDESDEDDTDSGEEPPSDEYQEPENTAPTPSTPETSTPPTPDNQPIPTPNPTVPYKTATATRNIVCSPEATIRIEAVGTGTITLQATGAQPVQGQGRVSLQATGTQIQVSAMSQSTSRAFVQFAWAWTQGGYCRQY